MRIQFYVRVTTRTRIDTTRRIIRLSILAARPFMAKGYVNSILVHRGVELGFRGQVKFTYHRINMSRLQVLLPPGCGSNDRAINHIISHRPNGIYGSLAHCRIYLSIFQVRRHLHYRGIIITVLYSLIPGTLQRQLIPKRTGLLVISTRLSLRLLRTLFLQ